MGARNLGYFYSFILVTDLHLFISFTVDILAIIGVSTGGAEAIPILIPGYVQYVAILVAILCATFFMPLTLLVVV